MTEGRLEGRRALVTGGSEGLGRAIAARLAADGARVAVIDLQPPQDAADAQLFRTADVGEPDQVNQSVGELAEALGGLDICVNNAGILSGRRPFLEASKDELLRFLTVNAVGYVLVTQAAHRWLADSTAGRVINVASRTFFTGGPGQLGYVASKGAVIGMTRVMARELGPEAITVNAVMPGQVSTSGTRAHSDEAVFDATMRQQAIAQRVQPEDLAGLVAFLASDDARLITGQTMICDGGGYLH